MAPSTKLRKLLEGIFEDPARSDVRWTDVEAMLTTPGAEVSEGRGWRIRLALKGVRVGILARPLTGAR